jgi:phosphotransferase family enzyme
MLRLPLRTELAAARAVAGRVGLGVVTPEVLHLGNHTSARLAPWPIVARIASGTSFDFSPGALAREVTVASHLSSREAPAVRLAPNIAPGPYLEKDCAITLWEFVDGRPASSDDEEPLAATSLQRVHAALADIEAELPSFISKVDSCETILTDPAQATELAEDDRQFLRGLYEALRNDLGAISGTWQPLHGDPHLGNVLMVDSGAIWMDLESVCVGPLEWDVGFLPTATWAEFPGLDAALMRLLADVRSLCVAVWCWAEFDRSAAAAEAAIYHLGKLRAKFT